MHISSEAMNDDKLDLELEDVCGSLNLDDEVSCISKQITLSVPIYHSYQSKKSLVIKNKYEYLGKVKSATTDSAKEIPTSNSHREDQLEEAKITLWHKSKVSLGWTTSHPHGSGMMNLGNTCYLNSSLQALFHIPSLANWLLEETQTHLKGCENNASCIGFCSICAMMRTINTSLNTASNTMKPALIHNRLKCIGKTLQYGRQEDAHEFIKLLLDHMQRSYILSCRAGKLDHRSRETTPLNQIFGGYLRQRVICPNCHHVSTTFSHFQDLVLDITSVGSVEDALRQYFQKETLDADNAYKCEKCTRRVPATKRCHIETEPNVLLLQLKRFSLSGGKINKNIAIRDEINLGNYLWNNRTVSAVKYKLVSMVNHLGSSQHSGHYTAVAKSSNGSMYEFDDNSVRYMHKDNVMNRNPYVLFYELVTKPKHAKIKQLGEIQVQSKNGFINHKPKIDSADKSQPGGSGLPKKEDPVIINGHSSLDSIKPNRNKISFEIKLKSDNNSRLVNDSCPSNSLSTDIDYINKNNVQTWDGAISNTFNAKKPNYANKRSAHDMYNEEYDVGKVGKKKFKYEPVRRQDNPFQSYQNRQQSDSDYRPRNMWSNGYKHKHYGHKKNFKSHGSYGGGYHRNGYQSKPWHYKDGYRSGNQGYGHYKDNRA